jgi:hypothetical protein
MAMTSVVSQTEYDDWYAYMKSKYECFMIRVLLVLA